MTPVEVLRKARAMIADPKDWCIGDYKFMDAVCAAGAINVAEGRRADDDQMSPVYALIDKEARLQFGLSLVRVNDELGHAAALKVFDGAIALASEQPS